MRFIKGQHVKLLLSANPPSWYKEGGCTVGIITDDSTQGSLEVQPTCPCTFKRWYVRSEYLELDVKVGEQLLFSFMKEE